MNWTLVSMPSAGLGGIARGGVRMDKRVVYALPAAPQGFPIKIYSDLGCLRRLLAACWPHEQRRGCAKCKTLLKGRWRKKLTRTRLPGTGNGTEHSRDLLTARERAKNLNSPLKDGCAHTNSSEYSAAPNADGFL